MRKRISLLVFVACAVACGSKPPEDPADYVAEISSARAEKDMLLQSDTELMPPNRRGELLPLGYFPIDPSYSVPAGLTPSTDTLTLQMPTSTGGQRQMHRAGTLGFMLKGQPMKLTAFVEVGQPDVNHLFVPFSDLTSGTETYPAGRYLDLTRNASGIYVIDFNRAYHPTCYYNPTYDCPYPPAENRLRLPIRSGERIKK